MNKYTIAQILAAWEAAFGEDMLTEYPGFIQRLTEEQSEKESEQKTRTTNGPGLPGPPAMASGTGTKLQASSGKLQATSSKLDTRPVLCYRNLQEKEL